MTHRERFLATVERKPVDRPAGWLGMPVQAAVPGLLRHFGVAAVDALKRKLGDDVYPVEVPYHCPPANHIACAFNFALDRDADYEKRTLTAPGFFAGCSDLARVEDFPWPDPANHMDPTECRAAVEQVPEGYAVLGILWSAHFQDACAAFGMEDALMTLLTMPEMFQAVLDRILQFYLQANEIFYQVCAHCLDAVLIGNDFGGQTSLMLSADLIRKHVIPGAHRLIEQAKGHGVKAIYHSCGAVREIIPDLIAAGADVLHPIQALATGMEASSLEAEFGDRVAFCGGVDAQDLLVRGTPAMVRAKVRELKEIFPTGLVISPSHEAIVPDIPPENVEALFAELTR